MLVNVLNVHNLRYFVFFGLTLCGLISAIRLVRSFRQRANKTNSQTNF